MEITLTRIYLTEESAFYQKDHGKIFLREGFALYWERDKLMLHETIRNDDFDSVANVGTMLQPFETTVATML